MGKKNKKSFYKKTLKPMVKGNRVLLAALGGVAAGITLATIMGTEKAKAVLHTVEDSVSNFADRVSRGMGENPNGNFPQQERPREQERNREQERDREGVTAS